MTSGDLEINDNNLRKRTTNTPSPSHILQASQSSYIHKHEEKRIIETIINKEVKSSISVVFT